MIEFPCHTCNSILRTPAGTEGKQSRCPSCGMIQVIPGGSAAAPGSSSAQSPQPYSSPATEHKPGAAPQSSFHQPAVHPTQPDPYNNPYSSPTDYKVATPGHDYYDSQAAAKLMGPAIGLLVIHILGALFLGLAILSGMMSLAEGGNPPEEDYVMLAICGFSLFLTLFCIFGSVLMLRRKMWGICITTTIISLVSGLGCCFLPTAFGIWGLVILIEPMVKNSFR